jgi:hypothetical protein
MIITWQRLYQNGEYYSAGLYGPNGIVGYSVISAGVVIDPTIESITSRRVFESITSRRVFGSITSKRTIRNK